MQEAETKTDLRGLLFFRVHERVFLQKQNHPSPAHIQSKGDQRQQGRSDHAQHHLWTRARRCFRACCCCGLQQQHVRHRAAEVLKGCVAYHSTRHAKASMITNHAPSLPRCLAAAASPHRAAPAPAALREHADLLQQDLMRRLLSFAISNNIAFNNGTSWLYQSPIEPDLLTYHVRPAAALLCAAYRACHEARLCAHESFPVTICVLCLHRTSSGG